MLIIKKGEKESIDKVLKRYKKKCRETRLLKDIRAGQEYVKPSTKKRKIKQRNNLVKIFLAVVRQ